MKWLRADDAAWDTVWERKLSGRREKQGQQEDEVEAVATVVEAEGSRGAQGKRGRSGGGQRTKGNAAGKHKKAKVQHQGKVRSDGGQGWQVTGKRRVEGKGGSWICDQGGVLDNMRLHLG